MAHPARPSGGDALIPIVDSAAGVRSSFTFSSPQGVRGKAAMKTMMQKVDSTPHVDKAWAQEHQNKEWQRRPIAPLPSRAELGSFAMNGNSVQLDEDVLKANLKKFDAALVGRLFGKKISFYQLRSELGRRWEQFGHFRLVTLSVDCFICYFDNIAARDSVLINGPWAIAGQVLGLDKWTATFSPSSMDGFVTPVWVRLPELPLYCWDSTNIARIISTLGDPLWIDAATECMDRGAFTRACVKLDLSKPLLAGVWVHSSRGDFFQRTEYEGLSTLCFKCGLVGHKEATYHAPSMAQVAHSADTMTCGDEMLQESHKDPIEEIQVRSRPQVSVGEELQGPGPWMVVQRRRRPQKKSLLPAPSTSYLKGKQLGTWSNMSHGGDNIDRQQYTSHSPKRPVLAGGMGGNCKPPFHGHSKEALPLPCRKEIAVSNQAMDCLHGYEHMQVKDRSTPHGQVQNAGQQVVKDISALPKPNAPKSNDSQHMEDRVGDEHCPSMHGLDVSLSSHGAIVPYNSQAANGRMDWEGGKRKGVNSLKVERMLNDLGPVSLSPRKRRMIVVKPGGGDASPLLSP